jgi:integrase
VGSIGTRPARAAPGSNPDAIERQLAHQEEDDVRRAYMDGADFWTERVAMMQVWSDYLDDLRERGKILPLVRAG